MAEATLSTHVLDLHEGRPAAGLSVQLIALPQGKRLAAGVTDADGRIGAWDGAAALAAGTYALIFESGAWFRARGVESFHPRVTIEFVVAERPHYHVPLLLNRFGFTTYRGS